MSLKSLALGVAVLWTSSAALAAPPDVEATFNTLKTQLKNCQNDTCRQEVILEATKFAATIRASSTSGPFAVYDDGACNQNSSKGIILIHPDPTRAKAQCDALGNGSYIYSIKLPSEQCARIGGMYIGALCRVLNGI